jgi:hypothetical protein
LAIHRGQDVLLTYSALDKKTGESITDLSVWLVSVKDSKGDEHITSPVLMVYNADAGVYECSFRVPDDAPEGVWTFRVKAEGRYIDIESGQFLVKR